MEELVATGATCCELFSSGYILMLHFCNYHAARKDGIKISIMANINNYVQPLAELCRL